MTTKRKRVDAIEEAGYRKQHADDRRLCSNCTHSTKKDDKENYCSLYGFFFQNGYVCNNHRFRETGF